VTKTRASALYNKWTIIRVSALTGSPTAERGGNVGRREGRTVPILEAGGLWGWARGERRDAAESRRKILGAARGLFERKGVDAVSMHEVGRVAGVGQGTLYRRFGHKGALCLALLSEDIEDFYEETWERLEAEERPALARLAWFLDRLAGFNERNADLLGAVRDAAGGERRVQAYQNPFYGWLRAAVTALLRRAEEGGEIRPGLDLECAADTLLAALGVDLYLYQRRELGMGRGRIVAALGSMLDGMRGPGR
jgi:AcrR family transcriptional regulator